ncbi:hypothetical protein KM043_018164 [Ampulex compressa]|nr:hypothetical protein KM043_018164 [Ampulex compressa]
MHTIPELGTSVPAFLAKLWKLVEDPETDDLICWSLNGRSFFIRNQAQFARELLPHYYKHNNMASFVRQLNMYGFHKKVSVELGGLKCDRDEMEFAHQFFCKGHPYLVEHIKRKIASSKGQDPAHTPIKPELMNKMLTEVRSMRGRQEHLDSRLGAMKRENEALWRELAMLRQKHLKQQQIVNKLIHFLVTLVQPSRGGGLSVKRRYPLMIDDSNRQRKQPKLSKPQASPTGPVIHELDASEPDLDSQYIVAEMLEGHQNPSIESPEHNETTLQADIQFVNSQEIDAKKKRGCKGKKKEETYMLENPLEESQVTIELLSNTSVPSKPVPVATVRSSKLAAMAANMNKSNDIDNDLETETSADMEEEVQENDSALVKLEDILIVPDVIQEESEDTAEKEDLGDDDESDEKKNGLSQLNSVISVTEQVERELEDINKTRESLLQEKADCNGASTSTSKDLSLSCVNTSGMSESTYRLGSMEEVDNHLESVQTELENLREILRGEGYSIDANTLLGLFGADDPMSFGIPVNPELNPHSQNEKEDDEHIGNDSINGSGGGELMAYNPTPSLLDFDDDIFLGGTSSSPITNSSADPSNNLYESDPLNLEDSKVSLLDSLVSNDAHTSS